MWDPTSQFQKLVLPNGLSIYSAQMVGREIETVKFIIHSGSLRDPKNALGTAHFLEHMLSENIDEGMLYDLFDKDGGSFNLGGTDRMSTEFSFTSTSESFEMFFEIFARMIMEERVFTSGIEKQREIIKREFLRKYPYKEVYELDQNRTRSLYPESHILSEMCSIGGSLDSIAKITSEDLLLFHLQYYTPSNISIVAIGGLSSAEIISIIKKSPFAEINKWGVEFEEIPKITEMREPSSHRGVLKVSDVSSIKMNSIGFSCTVVIPITVNDFVLKIFRRLLRRKLNKEIRENRSWAYSISCPIQKTDYAYEFEIECRELSRAAEHEIVPIIDKCIAEIRKDILGFEKVRKSFVAEYKFIDLNTVDTREAVVERISDYGDLISTEEIIEKINAVTFSQIREFCDMMDEKYRYYKIVLP